MKFIIKFAKNILTNILLYPIEATFMNSIIEIPCVDRDERIGSAFNHLFSVINQTENCAEDKVKWDFKKSSFSHPFFLAPLALYKKKCEDRKSVV